MRIPSVVHAKTNAVLIADYVRPLYLRKQDIVLDATFGKGNFWTKYEPPRFIKHDKYTVDGVDCRKLPEADESIDVLVLDLPYTSIGGRKTTTIKDFHAAYGLLRSAKQTGGVRWLIYQGMKEAKRVLKKDGLLMVKCNDYISSGNFVQGHLFVVQDAETLGFEQVDEFVHYRGSLGPQPTHNLDGSRRKQKHTHRAHSFLCIFAKP